MRVLFIVLCLLVPAHGWAAFSEVGSGSQRLKCNLDGGATSVTCAFPGSVTSGNLLIVAGTIWSATSSGATAVTVTGCSTSFSTAFLGATLLTTSGYRNFIVWGLAGTSGACTLTIDGNGTNDWLSFGIDEFAVSGGNTVALDVDGGSSNSSGTNPNDSITTLTANALIVAALSHLGADTTIAPGASHTAISEQEVDAWHGAEFRIATTATSYSVNWTLGASREWSVYTLAFKEVAGVACKGRQMLLGAGC